MSFVSYNIILHSSIYIINYAIIIKELILYWFVYTDSLSLSDAIQDVLLAINPITYINLVWEIIYSKDILDN